MKSRQGSKSLSKQLGHKQLGHLVSKSSASRPSHGEQEYHLRTCPGEIARYCLSVGDPGRAKMIAEQLFENGKIMPPQYFGDHRGLRSYTGFSAISGGELGVMPISVVTTGMGGPSAGIVTPEAVRCGARVIIRVGSCGGL